MNANLGGLIGPDYVVGRDSLIQQIWTTLEIQSIVILAERRMGTTAVIQKIEAEPAEGWVPVYQDLEKCHSAMQFALAVYENVEQFLSTRQKATRRVKEFVQRLSGVEIKALRKLPEIDPSHWKEILTQSIEDLIHENNPNGSRLLFLWDEFPSMLSNLSDREGKETVMEVLNCLRALRQSHPTLRRILAGSIALHHILSALKDHK